MKTVSKIKPTQEFENANKIAHLAQIDRLKKEDFLSLHSSIENLFHAVKILMEREERRRGAKHISPENKEKKGRKNGESRDESIKLPSQKYKDIDINENTDTPETPPACPCCGIPMVTSGPYDTSEKLEIIPKRYIIERVKRPKFRCSGCQGSMVNTPAKPSIVPTSNYGDSVIIDVALSKYCDLIPVERYVQMAHQNGLQNLPAQSLIGLTHHLANFLLPLYTLIKTAVLKAKVLQGDETPHKMLEGDDKKNWFLWGFFAQNACFFEMWDTRSAEVVFNVLKNSEAEYLVSDGYPGYGKAIKDIKGQYSKEIIEVHCNAHAYRYFKEAALTWDSETKKVIDFYKKIYVLEKERKENKEKSSPQDQLTFREKMLPLFEEIKKDCEVQKVTTMPGSTHNKAINYFLNHYVGLTQCIGNIEVPLDNNLSEREFRAPVVGRKTWYGTHSKKGAHTAAILFTVIQTCKMSNVNPRSYFPWIVEQIHKKKEILTPCEYSKKMLSG